MAEIVELYGIIIVMLVIGTVGSVIGDLVDMLE